MPDGRAPRAAGAVHGEVWIPAGGRSSLQPPAPFLNRRELGQLAAGREGMGSGRRCRGPGRSPDRRGDLLRDAVRSEEHTSELQSRLHLVCRLLLEKKKTEKNMTDV